MSSTGSDELLKLDNQLCFALYVCSKEIIKKYKPLLDPLGLTYTGYIAMMALWEKDNVTVKELGERLFLDSGTLTPLLKKLEASGFIARERSSSDERNVFVHLTDSGKKLKEKAKEVPTALICSSGLKLEDPVSLIKTLHSVEKDLTGDGL
ncbi:MAG: MarR family transcriptional regulator [Clostridiales bacterium]|nr:MarR family transcriptional regulator [Clostridiales bacterium]